MMGSLFHLPVGRTTIMDAVGCVGKNNMRSDSNLYVTQTVHVVEQQWFAAGYAPRGHDPANPLIRNEKHYNVHSYLFTAADAEVIFFIFTHFTERRTKHVQ